MSLYEYCDRCDGHFAAEGEGTCGVCMGHVIAEIRREARREAVADTIAALGGKEIACRDCDAPIIMTVRVNDPDAPRKYAGKWVALDPGTTDRHRCRGLP
jgi:formate-dependent nitrite reductase cytochrome c552 subunit